jgi:O-antigen/teichoic acid export membrane protein
MLGKKLSQSFVFSILSMVFSFVSSVFIARIGGAAIFGNISLATSFQSLLRQLFNSSLNNAHLKAYNEDSSIGLKNFLVLNLFFNMLTSISIVGFIFWNSSASGEVFSDLQISLIVIFILQDYLTTPIFMYSTNQYAKLNIARGNLVDFSSQLLISLAKIGAVLYGFKEIGIAWSIVGACALSSVYPLISLFKEKLGKVSMTVIRSYIKYALYIFTSAMAYGLLLSFDKILLGFFSVSAEDIGYYNAGNRLGILLMSLGVSVGGIFLSVFTKNLAEKNHEKTLAQLKDYERSITVFFLPVILVPIFFGEELISIIYGSAFASGYLVLVFSLLVAYIKTLTIPYQNFLFAVNRFKEFNRTSVIFAIAIVGLTTLFAYFDVLGSKTTAVALGLFVSCLVERMIFVWEAARIDKNVKLFFHPKEVLFFTLIIAAFFIYMHYAVHDLTSLAVRFGMLLAVIPAGALLGIYTWDDFYNIKGLVFKPKAAAVPAEAEPIL